ncbi:MAG: hypothetical protein NDJ90_00920 [Oligoflexia bacterium]|nr:hypothetical protein [Oligoflexia bacterium]
MGKAKRSNLLPEIEPALVDPFSKKGALALFWLLARRPAASEGGFSVNQAARELGIMPFTVHRVVRTLEYDGIIRAQGIATKKRFHLAEPKGLMIRWIRHYQIQRKSKLHRYGLSNPREFSSRRQEFLGAFVVPALHTAAQTVFRAGVTNLLTTEGYTDGKGALKLARKFGLIEQDRGYEVLLIEPYYLEVVRRFNKDRSDPIWKSAFAVLTFLDLYHFPLRGREQAEVLFRKTPALKTLGPWAEFEAIEVF